MKLLTGCQFDLSVLDHSMVYYSLFAKLASLSKNPVNEEAQADLLAGEVEFYKSDLFFTMSPVLYALATFDTWMEKHHPELQLSDLCGSLSEKTRDELHRAQDRIKKTIEATQAITRQDVQAAAKRFKAFFEALKSVNESLPACQADNFKR